MKDVKVRVKVEPLDLLGFPPLEESGHEKAEKERVRGREEWRWRGLLFTTQKKKKKKRAMNE